MMPVPDPQWKLTGPSHATDDIGAGYCWRCGHPLDPDGRCPEQVKRDRARHELEEAGDDAAPE